MRRAVGGGRTGAGGRKGGRGEEGEERVCNFGERREWKVYQLGSGTRSTQAAALLRLARPCW